MGLRNKINNGLLDRIYNNLRSILTIGGLSALTLLPGCSQSRIIYRARIQTKPPVEIPVYMTGKKYVYNLFASHWESRDSFNEYKCKTSKEGPVYVESSPHFPWSVCKIFLELNEKEIAYCFMNYEGDVRKLKDKQIANLKPTDISEHCLEARVTRWEKGLSYDLLFEIPSELLPNHTTSEKNQE